VGENLGTVPPYVNPALARHNIKGMYVMQYELAPRRKLPAVPSNCVASLNTHDTPLFAGFWQGLDIEDLRELGLVSPESANQRHEIREAQKKALVSSLRAGACLKNSTMSARAVFQASLDFLSSSSAHFVQVNLEDLWLEAAPQNVPGTGHERPNWRRKAVYTFEQFSKMPGVLKALGKVNKYRHRNGSIRIKKRELISNEES